MNRVLATKTKLQVPVALAHLSALFLGVVLPLAMMPSTKSSPLMLAIAAVLAATSLMLTIGMSRMWRECLGKLASPAGCVALALLFYAAISISWAHNPVSSVRQYAEMLVPVISATVLAMTFPQIAPDRRARLWLGAAALGAIVMIVDLQSGFVLRALTGGRATDYSYNRAAVTLVVLMLPLAALAVGEGQKWLLLGLLLVAAAGIVSASGTAKLALLTGAVVFPLAYFLPRFSGWAGLTMTASVLFGALMSGTIGKVLLSQRFHETLKEAHSGDRVDIWLSFEAVARQNWLFGNGFGSSLNLQNAPVAQLVAPERVLLLGASHPHNAFLQLWVELGLVGTLLACALTTLFFLYVMQKAERWLRPYWITWFAVIAAIALVSHGASQPWWIAAIGASAVGFLALKKNRPSK